MKVHKPRSKLTLKDIDVIFQFFCFNKKTHIVHMDNALSKASKKMLSGFF